jgi:hypothetical protein
LSCEYPKTPAHAGDVVRRVVGVEEERS